MQIETARLLIRPYTASDFAALQPILSDPITMQFWPAPLSDEQIHGWIERAMTMFAQHGFSRMPLIERASGAIIGDCGLMLAQVNNQTEHDLGYIIQHQYWRQGYASEAAQAWLDYSIDTLGVTRIVANMPHDHHGSRRVAERLGMHKQTEFHNQRNRDILTYLYVSTT